MPTTLQTTPWAHTLLWPILWLRKPRQRPRGHTAPERPVGLQSPSVPMMPPWALCHHRVRLAGCPQQVHVVWGGRAPGVTSALCPPLLHFYCIAFHAPSDLHPPLVQGRFQRWSGCWGLPAPAPGCPAGGCCRSSQAEVAGLTVQGSGIIFAGTWSQASSLGSFPLSLLSAEPLPVALGDDFGREACYSSHHLLSHFLL